MTGSLNRYTHLIGRILLSLIFILSGFGKIGYWSATAAMMASKGIPLVSITLLLTVLLELGGGLALLFGYQARLAAALLALWLVPVTLTFHNFWAFQGPEHQAQLVNFLKNLAIIGGLLGLASDGAGAISLDARRLRTSAGAR
jgi:putative oxidoreductase